MIRFIKFFMAVVMILGVSCSHNSHKHTIRNDEISLKNGKKWQSDIHTMNSIRRMQGVVIDPKVNGDGHLKIKLETELHKLIQGCSMKGRNHDALHSYLERLMALIDNLETEDRKEFERTEKDIEQLLLKFFEYFELS